MSKGAGRFILLEGISSTGKSIQIKAVAAALSDLKVRIFQDAEPTNGPFGRVIRAVIEKRPDVPYFEAIGMAWALFVLKAEVKDKIVYILKSMQQGARVSVLDMQLIFMADRFWHCVNSLGPNLENGENVLCDRYAPSTFAFGLAHGVELGDLVHWHNRILGKSYITPSLTIYVRIPPEVAAARLAKDGKVRDIFKTEAGIRRTAEAYEKVWEFGHRTRYFGRIVGVDGNQTIPKVTEAILSEAEKLLVD
jgi:dTMP kinase